MLIEDDVEIGANTTIDRATLGSTIIRKGVKLDNMIQIGHNVEVGENTVIAAQVGIAGSTKIGARNMIGGQVGFAGHITVITSYSIHYTKLYDSIQSIIQLSLSIDCTILLYNILDNYPCQVTC